MSDLDEFDDLDDYLDEFDAEILDQEPGATLKEEKTDIVGNEWPQESENLEIKDLEQQMNNFMNLLGNKEESEIDNSNNNDNGNGNINNTQNSGNDFQDAINQAINRIKESSKEVDDSNKVKESESQNVDEEEELLTTLFKSLDLDLDLDVNNEEGDDQDNPDSENDKMTTMLMKMLNKLTSKEMMYDSVASAIDSYNHYFEDVDTSDANLDRYKQQLKHLQQVKTIFDRPDYSAADDSLRQLVDQEMESFNAILPPPEGVLDDTSFLSGANTNLSFEDTQVPKDVQECIQQ